MKRQISFTTKLGDCTYICPTWQVASILRNLIHMALQGVEISNVTIKSL